MISKEPKIRVGVLDRCREVRGTFNGTFLVNGVYQFNGGFSALVEKGAVVLSSDDSSQTYREKEFFCQSEPEGSFTLQGVLIGIRFHWEREEDQNFSGTLRLVARDDGTLTAINEISVEEYLTSVISSEMSGDAPIEFLKAHAIASRSWLVAMLARAGEKSGSTPKKTIQSEGELIRWYDREDHDIFDVCADDHCQRYQGIAKVNSGRAIEAVDATRGLFILHGEKICDARFFKACGGRTEKFENAWEDKHIAYLESVSDSEVGHPRILTEQEAEDWILSNPDAYCNTTDQAFLRQILPSFDQETRNFFRWVIDYEREALEQIIRAKSGLDFGALLNLVPLQRGPSGRIVKLRIEGSKRTLVIGKELEIRRWLSETHLYSSAFVVMTERDEEGIPKRFLMYGAGWGHGVGMCQIGAAVMAAKGFNAEQILKHYYQQSELKKLY